MVTTFSNVILTHVESILAHLVLYLASHAGAGGAAATALVANLGSSGAATAATAVAADDFLNLAAFLPFLVSGARPRVVDIARSHSQATVSSVPRRPIVKLWNPNHLVATWCGRGCERLVLLTYSTPLIDE